MAQPPTLNLLQVIALLVIAYLTLRLLFSFLWPSSSSSTDAPPGNASARARPAHNGSRVNPAHVDQVAQMFPQLSRRDIMWDLQRNGGSVQATTERVLTGRGLEVPPPSFQPPIPQTSASSQTTQPRPKAPLHPDLITRYNLASKVSPAEAAPQAEPSKRPAGAWSSNKADRQANFQRRRNEMILAARRKMEEKEAATRAG